MLKTKNLPNFRIWLLFGLALAVPAETGFAQRVGSRGRDGNSDSEQSQDGGGRQRTRDNDDDDRNQSRNQPQQQGQQLSNLQQLQSAQNLRSQVNPAQALQGGARGRSIISSGQRVTVDLPPAFAEGDINKDGQIDLVEWKQWRRGQIQQFAGYDLNNDGFLAPIELATAQPPAGGGNGGTQNGGGNGVANQDGQSNGQGIGGQGRGGRVFTIGGNNVAQGGSGGRGFGNGDQGGGGRGSGSGDLSTGGGGRGRRGSGGGGGFGGRGGRGGQGDTGGGGAAGGGNNPTQPVDTRSAAASARFRLMDGNRDGQLSPEEFKVNTLIKAQFDKSGIDVSQPMSQEDFIKNFVQTSGGPSS